MEVLLWVQLVHLAPKLVLTIARKIQLENGEFQMHTILWVQYHIQLKLGLCDQ